MPKYLCAGRIRSRWINRVVHANPERVRGTAHEWRSASAAGRARLAAAVHLLDLGASDAVSAVDLVRALRTAGAARIDVVAADRDLVLVLVLSPVVAADEPSIEIVVMDCLAEPAEVHGRFDAMRASNLLHPRNFGVAHLRPILILCHRYLRESGCVVISRNDVRAGEVERGAVWFRTPTGFRLAETFGGGSEIDAFVESIHVSAECAELAS